MSSKPNSLLSISRGQAKVSVEFRPLEDRFRHWIRFENELVKWSLFSLEGDFSSEDDAALDSKEVCGFSLQEIHEESREDADVIFGVGMAHGAHFSVSVASNRQNCLRFDFACRAPTKPDFLGCRYGWRPDAQGIELDPVEIEKVIRPVGETVVEFQPNGSAAGFQLPLGSGSGTPPDEDVKECGLRVRPGSLPPEFPATIQWGFVVSLEAVVSTEA